jgi:nicotinate-nucleotide adenylyltransferase
MQTWRDLSKGIGILGGTFDPIHLGHVGIARATWQKYGLSTVSIIPAFQNPLRENEVIRAGTRDRLVMCYFASEDEEWLYIDPIEIERGRHQPGPSYTIHTLQAYRMRYPGVPLTLIVGADNVALHKWKDVDQFPELLSRIVAVARPDYKEQFEKDLAESRQLHPEVANMVEFLGDVDIPFSSTAVREALHNGVIPTEHLHPSVAKYVTKYGLYGCREKCS